MANHHDSEDKFVKERLAALHNEESFQPNAARARMRLQGSIASRSSAGTRARRWSWTAAAVVAAMLVAAMHPSSQASAMDKEGQQQSLGEWLMSIHNNVFWHLHALMKMAAGHEGAPDFALTDATGKEVRLSSYRGKVVLLNFWATWCAPCREEIPWFAELQKNFGDDLVILGISMDEDGWTSVRPFMAKYHMTYPVMLANDQLPERYRKIEAVPASLLIDKNGDIADVLYAPESKAAYERPLRDLINRLPKQLKRWGNTE